MNERIKELADRLWRVHPSDIDAMGLKTRTEFYEHELTKFADTNPPKRKWVGLTPEERDEIHEKTYGALPHHVAFHHAIEQALKEKNT